LIEAGGSTEYDREWSVAEAAKDAGRLREALVHYSAALAAARRTGPTELVDRTYCAEATIAIELGEADAPLPGLREILVRNGNPENCSRAARVIARAYELSKDYRKSLFYARIARDRAEQAHSPERLAVANNQIGNALLGQSFFDQAAESFRLALRTIPESRLEWRLICTANVAYCALLDGRRSEGMSRLYRVLREARRHQLPRLEMIARIDLCYAYLDLERLARAERCGRRGLELAEWIGEQAAIKNALYLLGQVAVLQGEERRARELFGELQGRFYPEQPNLTDFLVSVDVRPLINLRA
jgi:tetratricopeptide (TPR) repeat protein